MKKRARKEQMTLEPGDSPGKLDRVWDTLFFEPIDDDQLEVKRPSKKEDLHSKSQLNQYFREREAPRYISQIRLPQSNCPMRLVDRLHVAAVCICQEVSQMLERALLELEPV